MRNELCICGHENWTHERICQQLETEAKELGITEDDMVDNFYDCNCSIFITESELKLIEFLRLKSTVGIPS